LKVSEKVFIIDTMALGFQQTVACYVVKGRKTAIVDTGYASSSETVIKTLKQLGVEQLDYVIPTHVHLDHAGGVWRIAEQYPDAQVLAQEKAVKHLVDPSKLVASAIEFFGVETVRMFGEVKPIDEQRVFKAGDGETLSLGDVELTFIYTPGHAPHQMSVLVSDRTLITADAVPIIYPGKPFIIPTTPPPSFDYDLYLQSIRKLAKLDVEKFHTPHFGPTQAGEEYVDRLVRKVDEFIKTADRIVKAGGGVAQVAKAFERKLEQEAGQPLPPYALTAVKISSMGMFEYLRRTTS